MTVQDKTITVDERTVWDDVIVGAGSAGAVLAARLSEQPNRRVLLLEAGPDRPDAPEGPLGRPVLSGANWDYVARLDGAAAGGRQLPYRVGKVVGGSSAVNGAIALRGLAADFDGWAAVGNPRWAWREVAPCFAALEAAAGGLVPIECQPMAELNPVAAAFLGACKEAGLAELADLNGGAAPGAGLVPCNAAGRRRVSTARSHLAPARARPNLSVWDSCQVSRVVLRGHRATGVEVIADGRARIVPTGQVTLCAGAVNTPAVLQRSGVGAARHLTALGIKPAADLPGVGENLIDHPAIAIWALPRAGVCRDGEPWHQVMARLPELALFLANSVSTAGMPVIGDILGGQLAVALSAMVLSPRSRGTVLVRDATPTVAPEIVLRLASEPQDVELLMRGARLVWSLIRSPLLAELLARVVLWTDRMMDDDALLRRAVRSFVSSMLHPVGTARMGPAGDGMAVVDQHCQVHGLSGLRVVDASVMPAIPAATPNLTCLMIAERVASWMR